MRKWVVAVLIAFIAASIFYFSRLEPRSNTTSFIQITEKGLTGQHYWVKAFDPNAPDKQIFTIRIDQENTWNLVEENEMYLADYEYKSLDEGAELLSIKHPAKPD